MWATASDPRLARNVFGQDPAMPVGSQPLVASPTSGSVRIGCSGWDYAEWRGVAYPGDLPRARWLGAYADLFDTVELNATFYRLPTEAAVEGWASRVPDGFTFAAKVGSFGTHRKKLLDPETWLPRHLERIQALGTHLGPNLLQLPPRWSRRADRLDRFLDLWPTDIRCAVEVRDRSWLHDEVLEVLASHGAALCLHDLIEDHPWELTAGWTYLRFHGPHAPADPYRGRYAPGALRQVAERIAAWRDAGVDVYAYFNNDIGGSAVGDARALRSLVGEPVPGS